MGPSNKRVSVEDIAGRLGLALNWLSNFGIRVGSTRIEKYHIAMDGLAKDIQAGMLFARIGHLNTTDRANSMREHFALFFEAGEILSIYDELVNLQEPLFLEKLRDFTGGPKLSSEESDKSVFSRNIAFELQVAAHLQRCGFAPKSPAPADLQFVASGRNIVIECKRPGSQKMIDRRVHEACKQIAVRRKTLPLLRLRGIVAVDLSKALGLDCNISVVNHSSDVNQLMVKAMDEIVETHRPEWVRRDGDRAIGVLIRISALILNRETMSPVHCQQFGYAKMFNLKAQDEALSQQIGSRI